MNWETVQICLNSTAALVVLWSSVCALSHMTRHTRFDIRIAYILMGVGALAVLLAPGYLGRMPEPGMMLLAWGAALLCIANHRRRQRHGRHFTP
jgi:uncharacterized membrane protein YfcA